MIMVPLVLIMLYDNYVHYHKYVQLHAYIYLQSQIWLHLWLLLELNLWSQNSSPNTSDLWVQSLHTRQNWCNRGGNTIFKYINLFVGTVWKCPSVHIMNVQVIGDEFLSHLKSHQRSSAAFCRPVKFFHTDWIIISLWFLSYTQRHGHVRIEKGSVQTVAIQLECHYMLKH